MSKKPGFSGIVRKDLDWQRVDAATLELSTLRAVVIGGTAGIGRALALTLASRGAHVTVVGRTFRDGADSRLTFVSADLSSMREARRVGRELPAEQLDLVVFTNGIMAAPQREVTADGLERDLAVSYLSRVAILRELAPRLGSGRRPGAPRPRVFVVGFPGTDQAGNPDDLNAEQGYDPFPVHMNTVAGNEALVLDGAQRYPGIDFFGLNPGLIRTNIRGNYLGEGSLKHRFAEALIGLFTMSVETYGKRMAPLLVSPDVGNRGPAMFNQKGQAILASTAMTPDWVGKLMAASDVLLQRSAQG